MLSQSVLGFPRGEVEERTVIAFLVVVVVSFVDMCTTVDVSSIMVISV